MYSDEEIFKIQEILNKEYTDDIYEDEITVNGSVFVLMEDICNSSDELAEILYLKDGDFKLEFTRKGYKNYSYERWVDTSWSDWE